MQPHFSLTDAEFERLFEAGSLDPYLFTHEAHIRLAWIHIYNYGLDKACYNIVNQLQDYVKALGAEGKFNLTLTIASLKVIDHFMGKSDAGSFEDFIAEFPRLNTHFRELLAQHYSGDIFAGEAGYNYQAPDLMAF
jgi:hypothetical protein